MLGFMERIGSVDMAWRFWYGLMQQGGGRWVVVLGKVEFFFCHGSGEVVAGIREGGFWTMWSKEVGLR